YYDFCVLYLGTQNIIFLIRLVSTILSIHSASFEKKFSHKIDSLATFLGLLTSLLFCVYFAKVNFLLLYPKYDIRTIIGLIALALPPIYYIFHILSKKNHTTKRVMTETPPPPRKIKIKPSTSTPIEVETRSTRRSKIKSR
ncbi:hypothetical protein MXB_1208, partial [Myxobolus squamalis]